MHVTKSDIHKQYLRNKLYLASRNQLSKWTFYLPPYLQCICSEAVSHFQETWWRHQMETFSALLAGPFVRGIHRSSVNSPHKDQWRGALMFSLICAKTNGWVNYREADDLWRHCANYDVTVMKRSAASACWEAETMSVCGGGVGLEKDTMSIHCYFAVPRKTDFCKTECH